MGINFFTGVPDSLLQNICAYITDHTQSGQHIMAANEGNAVALAAGHYLATGKVGLVYMQNSGLGNAVNPLVSLTDALIYNIPVLILVGWRGEPGIKDEPQHVKQGLITRDMLSLLGIKYSILSPTEKSFASNLKDAGHQINDVKAPYAILVSKGAFNTYCSREIRAINFELSREQALGIVLERLEESDVVVSTTGKLSREIYEYREQRAEGHERDFLNVGSMGHASSVALAIAINRPKQNVYCLDGDGAMLMHMGALGIIATSGVKNYKHIVFNNGSHESVGGQPTVGFSIDPVAIAKACGYKYALRVDDKEDLLTGFNQAKEFEGPLFLEVRVNNKSRDDLGRPAITPVENKADFMSFLAGL